MFRRELSLLLNKDSMHKNVLFKYPTDWERLFTLQPFLFCSELTTPLLLRVLSAVEMQTVKQFEGLGICPYGLHTSSMGTITEVYCGNASVV